MRNVLFVTKKNGELSTDEVMRVFDSTDDLDTIKAAVEKAKDRVYASWASVDARDRAGEKIPIADIIKEQETLLSRNGPITDEHSNRVVGQTLSFKVLTNPDSGTIGVLHLNKIFTDNAVDDNVWQETQSGKRKGSSVGGINEGERVELDRATGQESVILENFSQLETANVENPCNPFATHEAVSAVAKSNGPVQKTFAGFDTLSECVSANRPFEDDPMAYCLDMQTKFLEAHKECTKSKKQESVINKVSENIKQENKSLEVDSMDTEEIKKAVAEAVSPIVKSVEELEKKLDTMKAEDAEEEKPEEEEKKKAKKEGDGDSDEKLPDELQEKKKEVDVQGDDEPESPEGEDANQETAEGVVKTSDVKKMVDAAVKKAISTKTVSKGTTPRGSTQVVGHTHVSKAAKEYDELPLKIALGTVRKGMREVNALHEAHIKRNLGGI